MPWHYQQLCDQERACIMLMAAQEQSLRQIARLLRRAPSSIYREIRRNAIKAAPLLVVKPGSDGGPEVLVNGFPTARPSSMLDASAASLLEALTQMLNRIPEPAMHKTLVYDQGKEMSRYKDLTARMGIQVYFADPNSP